MSKKQFVLTVGAYLTGWVIAQAVFLRVWKYVMREVYDEGYHDMARRMGKSLADELEQRQPVRCCVSCGAVVTEGTTRMHNEWHDAAWRPPGDRA